MRRALHLGLRGLALLVLIGISALGVITAQSWEGIGRRASGARLARMQASPQWQGASFTNALPEVGGTFMDFVEKSLREFPNQAPDEPIKTQITVDFSRPPESGLRVTWLGHSTLIVEIDGARVLIDPVWGPRTAPVDWAGPKRWYAPPLPLEDLPPLDAVLISHDHYDHLDHRTVKRLADQPVLWLVPLGVGAHLESWGVPTERIRELDWWEAEQVAGLTLTCAPARHFSGRFADRFRSTLWSGWALAGPEHRVFYTGDTSLHPQLAAIGERLGPFDLTLVEAGAYDALWTDVHLGPEQAVIAHQELRGALMMPVHWGLFDLANHAWTEPIERVLTAAEAAGVRVVMPPPGGSFEPANPPPIEPWWPTVPTDTVETMPVWSTSVEDVLARYGVTP